MMIRWPKIRIESRITVGLVSIFFALLLLVDVIFALVPNRTGVELASRQQVLQHMAVLLTQAIATDAESVPRDAVAAMARPDARILSVALRRDSGVLIPIYGDPARAWTLAPGAPSTLDNMHLAVRRQGVRWGQVEIAFRPIHEITLPGLIREPAVGGLLLLAVSCCGLVYFYLRRMLQHLDPSQVMPRRVREAFDVLDEGVLLLDAKDRVMMVNEAFLKLAPRPAPVRIGRPVDQFEWLTSAQGMRPGDAPWSQALRQLASSTDTELVIAEAAGKPAREAVIKASPIIDTAGSPRGTMVTLTDVSSLHKLNRELKQSMTQLGESREQLKRQNEQLHRLATCDPLTGCLNRRAFFDVAQRMIGDSRMHGMLTCIMVDIDHFKLVNDRYGHGVGDQVIQAVSKMLMQGVRGADLVCRYGGEEFCILLTRLDPNGAMLIAHRLRATIESSASLHVDSVPDLRITASLGLATFTSDVDKLATLIDRADQAMYSSKHGGRNRVSRWSPGKPTTAQDQLEAV